MLEQVAGPCSINPHDNAPSLRNEVRRTADGPSVVSDRATDGIRASVGGRCVPVLTGHSTLIPQVTRPAPRF